MSVSLLDYNKTTNTDDYNCGGFALNSFTWYCPDSYDCGQSLDEMLEECAADILKDFPKLSRIDDYEKVPDQYDVIGFRIAWGEHPKEETDEKGWWHISDTEVEEGPDDFHFILRHDGEWFHKPGERLISRFYNDIEDEWPRGYKQSYNSRIIWFVRRTR